MMLGLQNRPPPQALFRPHIPHTSPNPQTPQSPQSPHTPNTPHTRHTSKTLNIAHNSDRPHTSHRPHTPNIPHVHRKAGKLAETRPKTGKGIRWGIFLLNWLYLYPFRHFKRSYLAHWASDTYDIWQYLTGICLAWILKITPMHDKPDRFFS